MVENSLKKTYTRDYQKVRRLFSLNQNRLGYINEILNIF